MDVTNRRNITFLNAATEYLKAHPNDNSRFEYGLKRVSKEAMKNWKAYEERRNDAWEIIEVKRVATEEINGKKLMMIDAATGKFRFEPEEYLAVQREKRVKERELLDETCQVTPYIVAEEDVPKDLTEELREVFTGFVLQDRRADRDEESSASPPDPPALKLAASE